jgi:hypothetical protein
MGKAAKKVRVVNDKPRDEDAQPDPCLRCHGTGIDPEKADEMAPCQRCAETGVEPSGDKAPADSPATAIHPPLWDNDDEDDGETDGEEPTESPTLTGVDEPDEDLEDVDAPPEQTLANELMPLVEDLTSTLLHIPFALGAQSGDGLRELAQELFADAGALMGALNQAANHLEENQ